MKKIFFIPCILLLVQVFVFHELCRAQSPNTPSSKQEDWSEVEKIFDKKGSVDGHVFQIAFPRFDLKVKVGEFTVTPELALTSRIAFTKAAYHYTMMGDLVVTDKEEPAAVSKLIAENLTITAIHNHLLNESPAIKYIHFSGEGDAKALAEEIKNVLLSVPTPLATAQAQPQTVKTDWSKVEAILGPSAKKTATILEYNFPSNERVGENSTELPAAMGMTTTITFQIDLMAASNMAAVAGNFILSADEVNPVAKELSENGITVTAIHNHSLYDNPRLFMLHFWAVNEREKLAKALSSALNKTNSKR